MTGGRMRFSSKKPFPEYLHSIQIEYCSLTIIEFGSTFPTSLSVIPQPISSREQYNITKTYSKYKMNRFKCSKSK
ncbi:hypothetical protein ACTXT7_014337 [Hymenolepis weldensis]